MYLVFNTTFRFSGAKRWLNVTSYSSLRTKLLNSHSSISGAVTVQTENIGEISGCMMYTTSEVAGRCVIVAATQDYISVIHYSNSRHTFSTLQVGNISLLIVMCVMFVKFKRSEEP